ncbi:MAG: Rne/Rng family ribonuclease [Clostridia bacterium]|nr:Rne/Rng family ribonuclease [Clostridia bacterium]
MRELLITYKDNKKIILLLEDGQLAEKYEEQGKKSIEGNIYIGKVQNVLKGLQSAFINIGEGKNAFIHVKDILPKTEEIENNNISKSINELIKTGDQIIVEVKRESSNYKGPRVSTHITLAGIYTVLMPNSPFITVSKKIEDEEKRKKLKDIVENIIPEGMGAIIRTSAEHQKEENIEKDIKRLLSKWREIETTTIENCPKMIYSKDGIVRKTLIDLSNEKLEKITVENEELKNEVENILKEINGKTKVEVKSEIIREYFLEKKLKGIENRKIYLKSGGFITIDKTEALTAIDVNSGKFIGNDNLENTIMKVNLEATKEIAKQIRLRDIGGIIIIDFIDMYEEADRAKILEEMKNNTKFDRSKIQIEGFTRLDLLELTRKHIDK